MEERVYELVQATGIPIPELVLVLVALLFLLEVYIRYPGTRYDSEVGLVRDVLVWMIVLLKRGEDSTEEQEE